VLKLDLCFCVLPIPVISSDLFSAIELIPKRSTRVGVVAECHRRGETTHYWRQIGLSGW
jgi:hypothetical protein